MAPKTQKRSSNDFVVSDNDDDDDGPPKSKRVKAEKIGKASKADKAANTKGASAPKKGDAKAGASVAGGGKVNNEGEEYWELSNTRRVVVSAYGGKRMVNIREYYEKDGEHLPGKKGISMPLAQFSTLVTLLPHIETVLKGKGEELPRPNYGGAEDGGDDEEEEEGGKEGKEAEDDDDEDVEEEKPSKKGKKGKRNFEETSDED